MPDNTLRIVPKEKRKQEVRVDDKGMLDVPFLVLVLLLVCIGLIMMFSASYARAYFKTGNSTYYFIRQAGFAAFGLVAMYLASRINCHIWQAFAKLVYAVAVVLLLGVLVMGETSHGAKRWIRIAGQQFQPSEIAKFAIVCMFASMVAKYKEKMKEFRYGVVPFAGVLLVVLALVALEKHLSAIMIIGLVAVIMMFVGGTQKRWLALGVGAALVFVLVYITVMGYAGDRVSAWLDPEADPGDTGYQIVQSQYAIGSGGLFGLGFGKGRQKYLYLPEEHNDYIFAIVCEELGFVGALGIIALFALLIIRGYWISLHAPDRFSTMLGVGLTSLLAVQVILNMAVVSNLLPSTGVALPFFSYGGTTLLMNLGEMGILLSISRWSSSART